MNELTLEQITQVVAAINCKNHAVFEHEGTLQINAQPCFVAGSSEKVNEWSSTCSFDMDNLPAYIHRELYFDPKYATAETPSPGLCS